MKREPGQRLSCKDETVSRSRVLPSLSLQVSSVIVAQHCLIFPSIRLVAWWTPQSWPLYWGLDLQTEVLCTAYRSRLLSPYLLKKQQFGRSAPVLLSPLRASSPFWSCMHSLQSGCTHFPRTDIKTWSSRHFSRPWEQLQCWCLESYQCSVTGREED